MLSSVWQSLPTSSLPPAPLREGETCDLAIIGGGILGLSTALSAVRLGLSVRVLEARDIGEAASGLSGGQVIPGLKHDPDTLIEMLGERRGEALIRFCAGTADAVFGLIAREGLAVPHHRAGWIQAAHTPAAVSLAERRARQWAARGVPARSLSADKIGGMTGARGYLGGWLDPRAGVIDPLAYVRELARAATAAGARIAPGTRATRLAHERGAWTVETAQGPTLRAKGVLVATNAYSDALVPGLARTLVTLHSFQIATARLPAALAETILPGGQAVSDSRRLLVYFRKSPDGRLMLGGRGSMAEPQGAKAWAHLERAVVRLFPVLQGVAIEKRWFGRVAMTLDHLPHIHVPKQGLITVAGCQGRGIGLMTALAPCLATYAATGEAEALPLPLTPIRPIPLHALRSFGIAAAIAWKRALDGAGL